MFILSTVSSSLRKTLATGLLAATLSFTAASPALAEMEPWVKARKDQDYSEASSLLKEKIETLEKAPKQGDHPVEIAKHYSYLGSIYFAWGKTSEAESNLKTAISHFKALKTPPTYQYGTALNNLGELYRNRKDYDQALPQFKKALTVMDKQKPGYSTILHNTGMVYFAQKEFKSAAPYFRQAADIALRLSDDNRFKALPSLNRLAMTYALQDQYGKAGDVLSEAVPLAEKAYGPDDPKTKALSHGAKKMKKKAEKQK